MPHFGHWQYLNAQNCYQNPQYTLSERQDSMLAEYDRHLEPNRYKPTNTSVVRNKSVFNLSRV